MSELEIVVVYILCPIIVFCITTFLAKWFFRNRIEDQCQCFCECSCD